MRSRATRLGRSTARRLTSHWVFVSVVLGVIAIGLLVSSPFQGLTPTSYTDIQTGPKAASDAVPSTLVNDQSSAVGRSGDTMVGLKPMPRHVALTFDDGPDPRWTPKIRAVLRKHGVHATFFLIGSEAARHPEQVRGLDHDGDELGSHTFSHVNIANANMVRTEIELAMTQTVLEGITGRTTSLFRPPYSSVPDAVTDKDWGMIQRVAKKGYLTVFTTVDTEDWTRHFDLDATLRQFDRASQRGEVVLMHDGGGNRSRTAAALDQLIPALRKRGYDVGTVSQAFGLKSATQPVGGASRIFSATFAYGLWFCSLVVSWLSWAVLLAGIIAAMRAAILIVASTRHRQVMRHRPALRTSDPVTTIVPAYNEEAGIEATIRSLVASTQPVKVIVVDDGSTDRTAEIVRSLNLPQVELIVQENAGKAAALNTGLVATTTDLVVMVDGDTIFEPDTLEKLIEPFADPRVGAVSGNAKVANRGGFLGRWQHIEYVIGFNMDRRMYDVAECMPTVPGAIGGFRVDALRAVGGLGTDTLAEDTDLTMALGSSGWLVRYAPRALAWTEAPNTMRALWKQRYRWSYGTMQAMWKHRMGLTERSIRGRYLRRSLAYMTLFQVIMPALAPAIDLFTLFSMLSGNFSRMAIAWLVFQAIDMTIAIFAFRADKESLKPLWALPFTQFCYRQMMYLVVVQSIAQVVTGRRLAWQRMERYGTHQANGATPVGG